jgi:threonine aldolase
MVRTKLDLRVHLDGARVFNAATALGKSSLNNEVSSTR